MRFIVVHPAALDAEAPESVSPAADANLPLHFGCSQRGEARLYTTNEQGDGAAGKQRVLAILVSGRTRKD